MTTNISKKSEKKFIVVTVLISLTVSLVLAEWVLRYQREFIEKSDQMDPGMMLYDARLGWKLKPFWSGRHHHYDYDVSYTVNESGFRGIATAYGSSKYAIVGDSFSFGLGVNDDETFVALLNNNGADSKAVKNFSVPGYSTDQQLLLLKKNIKNMGDQVLLVVYLGNDIFDNMRAYPLQADHGKPYFNLANNALVLQNTPVPLDSKPAKARKETISNIVLADKYQESGLFSLLSKLELSRRLGLFAEAKALTEKTMHLQFTEPLSLFIALIDEFQSVVENNQAELSLVLMPGRSYVEQPASISAQYQEYFREHIRSSLESRSSVNVIDLATHLRAMHNSGVNGLYFPNEGHLTALGHKYVAQHLLAQPGLFAVTDQAQQ